MKKYILVLLLLAAYCWAHSQVAQVQNAPYNFVRGTFNDSMLTIPRGCDTTSLPRTKYGEPTNGALYFDTCGNALYVKGTFGWIPVGLGDTTNFENVIDSTGNDNYRVLFAKNGKITGESAFVYRDATNTLRLNYYLGSTNNFSIQAGDKVLIADSLLLTAIETTYDTTLNKPTTIDANGVVKKLAYWPVGSGGGGGSGTVTSVATNDGTGITGGTITTSGTLDIDTLKISTRAWRDKLADSLGAIIATKGTGTVTSVGLTMPSAFSVAGSPVTSSGTLAVTGAGTTSQYIRGDGSLATFSGFSSDSLAIRRKGTALQNIVSFNSASNGTAGTVTADSATIAIGDRVLRNVTSGQGNIGIGSRAAEGTTTGQFNIAIGKRTFETSQTGNSNVAIGNEALFSSNGVSDQVAIGRSALRLNSSGTFNTAVGALALTDAAGSSNTGVGYGALTSITSGARNTGIGHNSGVEITTASDNTLIGYFAGRQGGTSKASNVAIGSEAARFDAGSFTVMLGMQAGLGASAGSITHTGNYNIGIGYQAMRNTTTIRSGSSNIAIGDRIDLPSVTSSNQVTIGSNAVNWLTRFTGGGWLVNHSGSAVTSQTASAALEVKSTTGGFLMPSGTSTQRSAISTPATGLQFFDTDSASVFVYDGTEWEPLDKSDYSFQALGADVTITTGGTYYDALSIVLPVGVWQIFGQATIVSGSGTPEQTIALFDGTNYVSNVSCVLPSAGNRAFGSSLFYVANITSGTTTFTLRGTSTVNSSTIRYNYRSANNTLLYAVRIR